MRLNRIAIMGTGSLGTILGAYITKGGRAIDLIDVNKAHVDALNEKGATICGTVDLNVPVHAITPDEMEGKYDLFLYLAKQTYNDTAVPQMVAHLADDGIICTLQNGIPEPAIAEYIGEDRTVGCTVGWGATWLGPGVSEATTIQPNWSFHLGRMDGRIDDDVLEIQSILELMCPTSLDTNWMGARWMKLIANVAMSGMSAALGCTFGDVLDNPKSLLCAQLLARECVRVTVAQGITPATSAALNKTVYEIYNFHNEEERKSVTDIFFSVWGTAHRASKASMLQDLEKGRRSEIDAINGILCDMGAKFGEPTPISDTVRRIVHDIEDGKRTLGFHNLDEFNPQI